MRIQPMLTLIFFSFICATVSCGRHNSYGSYVFSDERAAAPLQPKINGSCVQTYGFLPCTTAATGNVFLILAYGYLMYLAATSLSNGSELLLQILGPGIIGGLFLPILGALPDAMLILVSGLHGSKETAQSHVSVGMGLLAGSTVLLLTVIWGTCVIVGKCDLENSMAKDSQDTKFFSLTGSGVSTDIWTSYAGIIMAISVLPYAIVQLPQISHSKSARHLSVLIALVVSLSLLVCYCLYQIFQPWVQRRRLAYANRKHVISGILKHFNERALGRLLADDGRPDEEVVKILFHAVDENEDGFLSHSELRALIIGIQLDEINLEENDAIERVMKDFDTTSDSRVSVNEFIAGVGRWIEEANSARIRILASPNTMMSRDHHHEKTRRENNRDEDVELVRNPRWITTKAILLLLLGTATAAAFANPLVDAVNNFSNATKIPTFFISFIALPLATNSSEAVSAIIFASRKKLRTTSLTFSELYGAVSMNNMLCLSVFLALVYGRGLVWNFTSEVLVILVVCIVMGLFASTRTTFPLWTCFLGFSLYPFSLALVYVLDYVFHWS